MHFMPGSSVGRDAESEMKRAFLLVVVLAAAVALVRWASQATNRDAAAASNVTSSRASSIPTSTTATYSFEENASPARLMIPSIKVDAVIEPVGIARDGLMAVTRSFFTVGWYKNGPVPGALGTAVIEGHLDQVTSPYAVFFYLDQLKPGDEVDVLDVQQRTVRFVVTTTTIKAYNAPTNDIFLNGALNSSSTSHLNLITCTGTWIEAQHQYDKRLVVFTTRVE